MSSVWFSKQDLGVFQDDLPKISNALARVDMRRRTQLDKYTILDLNEDPQFATSGLFKTVYYCISLGLAAGEFTVYVALRSSEKCEAFQKEKRVYTILNGAKGVLQPLLFKKLGAFEYMVSELFNRGDLIDFINDPTRPLQSFDTHMVCYSIANALLECHSRGVVLRDLKPENILVKQLDDGSIVIKLIDFGFSFIVGEDGYSEAVKSCGSPIYISPEDWAVYCRTEQFPPADYSRDLWPLGSILYSLATGTVNAVAVMGANNEFIGLTILPEDQDSLGIFDREIRDLIYKEQKHRPSLQSIEERMRTALISMYPSYFPIAEKKWAEPRPNPETSPEILETHQETTEKPSLLSRICSCFSQCQTK